MTTNIYTIGHSTHSMERLTELLQQNAVTAVADVRSTPFSRQCPQFNKDTLAAALANAGIEYSFLGRELGARPHDRSCYVAGRVQYDALASTSLFQAGLRRIVDGSRRYQIALLCAERDPLACHRAILVSRHLAGLGIGSDHILPDGQIEKHEAALERLLSELGMQDELFRGRETLIEEAYRRRALQIAYVDASLSASAVEILHP
jgi:uncharacterized protein (DUF488 family)